MKFILKIFLMILISLNLYAQNSENEIKDQLKKIIELSKTKNYEKAAKLIAYSGEDNERTNKDSFDSTKKDELEKVKRICKKISALIDLSSKYEITNTQYDKSNSNIYIIDIIFTSGSQNLTTQFSFIKTDKGYLLTNLN